MRDVIPRAGLVNRTASKGGSTISEKKTQIVILGGGFGGMYCALELEKALARGKADVLYVADAFEVIHFRHNPLVLG